MKITTRWLVKKDACEGGMQWFENQREKDSITVLNALLADNEVEYASWLVIRLLSHRQQVSYAIFAAEQVIGIYEAQYPDDKRPRNAINAAKVVLKWCTAKNKAAYAATSAATSAAKAEAWADASAVATSATSATSAAVSAFASGAVAAANAAVAAANAAIVANATAISATATAEAFASGAADAASVAAYDANTAMKRLIIEYGIGLLKKGVNSHG